MNLLGHGCNTLDMNVTQILAVEETHEVQWTTTTSPPSLGLPPLSKSSLDLSVVPLGIVLLVDASRMLAIMFELSPPRISA